MAAAQDDDPWATALRGDAHVQKDIRDLRHACVAYQHSVCVAVTLPLRFRCASVTLPLRFRYACTSPSPRRTDALAIRAQSLLTHPF